MALRLVLSNDASFDLLSLILIVEAEKDEAKASATLSQLFTHHNGILNLAKLLKVCLQVLLGGREGQPTDEELHLILLSWLVERGCRSVAAPAIARLSTHVTTAHATRETVLQRWYLEVHHVRQVVVAHIAKLSELAQLHQVKALIASLPSDIVGHLAHGAA